MGAGRLAIGTRSGTRQAEPVISASLAAWHPYAVDRFGRIDRRYYELCVLWELRAALRAGDVWLETSRRYANPESYLIPPASWPASRPEVCTLTQTPPDGATRVTERQTELEALLRRFDDELPRIPASVSKMNR
jgi:hypothetical protein